MSTSAFPYGTMGAAYYGPAGILVLTTGGSNFTDAGVGVWSGWEFTTDGGLDEIGPGVLDRTAKVSGEYYSLEPETGAGDFFEVRCASLNSGVWNTQAATVGTWVALTSNRAWFENVVAMAAPSSADCSGNFELGRAGRSTAQVGPIELTASANN